MLGQMYRLPENLRVSQTIRGFKGGSRTAATSKMERFVIIVNVFQPLTIITKRFILDFATVLDPPLWLMDWYDFNLYTNY